MGRKKRAKGLLRLALMNRRSITRPSDYTTNKKEGAKTPSIQTTILYHDTVMIRYGIIGNNILKPQYGTSW